jgi:uncharacterized protein YhjY with autotransporter beta-barrel domain
MNMNFNKAVAVRIQVNRDFSEATSYQEFVKEITKLRLRVQELEKDNSDMGWQLNPDRMGGGGWTADELDPNRGWK